MALCAHGTVCTGHCLHRTLSAHGTVCTGHCLHMALSAQGTVCTWHCLHMALSAHGTVCTGHCLHRALSSHGTVCTWHCVFLFILYCIIICYLNPMVKVLPIYLFFKVFVLWLILILMKEQNNSKQLLGTRIEPP